MSNHFNTSCKIDLLFSLGKVERHRDWVDYRKLGFEADDIPQLIQLLSLTELRESAEPQLVHEFAPIHAWRILGQLQHIDAVAPLIELLPSFRDNDWAISELPQVFGMIGSAAIKPLSNCALDLTQAEIARVLAMDSLIDISYVEPHTREEIISLFSDLIGLADRQSQRFNGLLVVNLIELQKDVFSRDIRDLYQRNLVDTLLAGDIDEIGPILTLGAQDIEPLDDLTESPSMVTSESAANDMSTTINLCLSRYAQEKSLKNLHQLDGLLTALCCSPRFIPSSFLEPAVWGGNERLPSWENEQEHYFFVTAISLYKSIVNLQLREGRHRMFAVVDDDSVCVEDWCRGFIHGVQYWEAGSPQAMDKLAQIVGKMFYLIHQQSNARIPNQKHKHSLQIDIESSLWELYRHCHPAKISHSDKRNLESLQI